MEQGKDTLDAIYPPQYFAEISGERKVVVRRIKLKHMKPVIDLVSAVVSGLFKGQMITFAEMDGKMRLAGAAPDAILQLIANNIDSALALISYHVELPKTEIDDLDLEDAFVIFAKIMEINADFFVRRVVPLLLQMATSEDVLRGENSPPTTQQS